MTTFERLNLGCLGVLVIFAGIIFLVLFWPLGILLAVVGTVCLIGAIEKMGPQVIKRSSGPSATLDFGPLGPPVAVDTPALEIYQRMIFPSAIRAITFYPSSPPDLRVFKGVTTSIPGTGRGHYSFIELGTFDELTIHGADDMALRNWVLRYVPKATRMEGGISVSGQRPGLLRVGAKVAGNPSNQ